MQECLSASRKIEGQSKHNPAYTFLLFDILRSCWQRCNRHKQRFAGAGTFAFGTLPCRRAQLPRRVRVLATIVTHPVPLALDHLTVVDTTPSELVSVASAVGCQAVCMFLEPMAVLPLMPHFSLHGITPEARETRARMDDLGVGLDLAYPFTLAGRTELAAFRPALETAAWLGARAVNVLLYDRDPIRRFDNFAAFCAMSKAYGLDVAVEFYPPSQLPTLEAALALVCRQNEPGRVGVNVDLLHLMRSGGSLAALSAAPAPFLRYAQYCDAPLSGPPTGMSVDEEASAHRQLPGAGEFDLAGFAACLPAGLAASVEVPRNDAVLAGVPRLTRARQAVDSTRRQIMPD